MSEFEYEMSRDEAIEALELFDFSSNGIDVNLDELFEYVKPSSEDRVKKHNENNYQAKLLAAKLISFINLVLSDSEDVAQALKLISDDILKENSENTSFNVFAKSADMPMFARFLKKESIRRTIINKIVSEFDVVVSEFFENRFFVGFYKKSLVDLIDSAIYVLSDSMTKKLTLGAKQLEIVYAVNQVRMLVNHAIAMEDYLAVKKEQTNK